MSKTPYIVDLTVSNGGIIMGGPRGSYSYGSNRFTTGIHITNISDPSVAQQVDVYVSSDGGVTWSICDPTNSPITTGGVSTISIGLDAVGIYWKPGERFVYFVYAQVSVNNSVGPLAFVSFDLQLQVWGTPVSSTINGVLDTFATVLNRLSDNSTFIVAFTIGSGVLGHNSPYHAYVVTYNGTWGVPLQVDDSGGSGGDIESTVLDSSDRLHVLYTNNNSFGQLKYRRWSTGTLSSSSVVSLPGISWIFNNCGVYVPSTDQLLFPFANAAGGGGSTGLFTLKGSPSSGPTFSTEEVVAGVYVAPVLELSLDGMTIYFVYPNEGDGISTSTVGISYLTQAAGSGTWVDQGFFWNWGANPPQPNPGADDIEGLLYFNVQGDGSISASIGTQSSGPIFNWCGALYYLADSIIPLTLSCPVGAGAATLGQLYGPFDLNSTTSGGTSPYTFDLASGMLPPGVTLSPSGIITGVPTVSGVFEYSPRVMDSSSPVQTATTSAPCGVGVGAALSPCAGVIPQPSTDVQFELRRVYCTMKPAPRIPVRGS